MAEREKHAVYLLFLNRELVYVGRSKKPEHRIETHRRNGRPFDYCLVLNTPPGDDVWVELALIKAFQPPHNRTGLPGREGSSIPAPPPAKPPRVIQIVRPAPAPMPEDPELALTTQEAESRAKKKRLLPAFKLAVQAREIPWAWTSEHKHCRHFRAADVDAWIRQKLEERFAA